MVQDGDPVGQTEDDVHVVLDHGDGDATVADLTDDLGEPVDILGRDPGHRLVEEQDGRLRSQGHGELELATVAVREVPREEVRATRHTDPLEERHDARPRGRPRPPERREGRRPLAWIASRTFSPAVRPSKAPRSGSDRARPSGPVASRRVVTSVRKVIRPVVGRGDPAEDVDQGRLARPAGADDAEQLTGPHVDGDVLEDLGATDLPADGAGVDHLNGVTGGATAAGSSVLTSCGTTVPSFLSAA